LRAAEAGLETIGIYDGWQGLLDGYVGEAAPLELAAVRTWDREGGTLLGSSRTNPFKAEGPEGTPMDRSREVMRHLRERRQLRASIPIGGEAPPGVAARLATMGAPIVGIPKTIDKDLGGTDYTLGFDTSMRTCADIIERSRTPAGSHHWVQVVEVMGRHAGHLALWSGLAGGGVPALVPGAAGDVRRGLRLVAQRRRRGPRDP